MDGGLLSLKWNNHRSTFFYVLSNVRKKECYTDVTLACDGKFYPVHKLVLSTCSEYFEQMFEHTQCKHPVIVLKDIRCEELESLLSYMYVGEVNVVQEKLSGLIKAAECLRIKGLAVPDEEPTCSSGSKASTSSGREKRTSDNSVSSEPKRRRQDDGSASSNFRQSSNSNVNSNRSGVEDRRKSQDHQSSSSSSNKFRNSTSSSGNVNSSNRSPSASGRERLLSPSHSSSNDNAAQNVDVKSENAPDPPDDDEPQPVNLDDGTEPVKQEPVDLDAVYLSDSNSASENKDILMDNFVGDDGGGQQHFMDELLGQNSGSDQGHMGVGDYGDGEGSSGPSAGGSQQQQHMVGRNRYNNCSSSGNHQRHNLRHQQQQHRRPRRLRRHHQHLLEIEEEDDEVDDDVGVDGGSGLNNLIALASAANNCDYDGWNSELLNDNNLGGLPALLLQQQQQESEEEMQFKLDPSSSSYDDLTEFAHCALGGSTNPDGGKENPPLEMGATRHVVPFDELVLVPGKAYECPLCVLAFADKARFRRHYMTHSGEKPYACELCPYRARQSGTLRQHMTQRHGKKAHSSRRNKKE